MANIDNSETFDQFHLFAPVLRTTSVNSASADLDEYNSATVCFYVGDSSDTLSGTLYWTLTIEECDDNATWVAVADAEITNRATNSVVINAPGEDNLIEKIGYKGNARYVRGVATLTGALTYGMPIAIWATVGNKRVGPYDDSSTAGG